MTNAHDHDDRVTVKLIGEDGNVFAIIGRVQRALIDAGRREAAAAYVEAATSAHSYDEVLRITMAWVDVV